MSTHSKHVGFWTSHHDEAVAENFRDLLEQGESHETIIQRLGLDSRNKLDKVYRHHPELRPNA